MEVVGIGQKSPIGSRALAVVIKSLGRDAIVVEHDWGGMVALKGTGQIVRFFPFHHFLLELGRWPR